MIDNTMRVLILGGNEMLGHKVFQILNREFNTFATFREQRELQKAFSIYEDIDDSRLILGTDAMAFVTVKQAFDRSSPDAVINCIGLIKQLKEAEDPVLTIEMNSIFPHKLAELATERGTKLIHISTDCVFNGRKGNYTELDPTDAGDIYGRSKALGEVTQEPHLTIRTSIIGREWYRSTGLLEWFISNQGGEVRGYRNAIYSGLTTEYLARTISDILIQKPDISGLYHISSNPITKLDLLLRIRNKMNLNIGIEPYDDSTCDRSLNSDMFYSETGFDRPTWDEMISSLAQDNTPYDEWRTINASARG